MQRMDGFDLAIFERQARTGRQLARARLALVDALDLELAPCDLTAAQFVVLDMLVSGRAEGASQLCKELSYDRGAMTRMLHRLELKGFIQRERGAENRREVKLVVSGQGTSRFPEIQAAAARVVDRFFQGFTPEDMGQFKGFLDKAMENMGVR